MSAEVVNLRRARKRRDRAEGEAAAAANRIAHGTPKALHALAEARRALETSRLDAHRLDAHRLDANRLGARPAEDDPPA